jgi:hypothetical protein
MNIQKLTAIVAAILINFAVLAWFHAWTTSLVASATPPAHADKVQVLPTINVYPTAEQLRAVRQVRAAPKQADAGAQLACIDMPFYSFAAPCTTAVGG